MNLVAKILSVVFHPLFILFYIFLLLHMITPSEFVFSGERQGPAVHLLVFGLSVFFPVFSVAAFRSIGLIQSFQMEDSKERIGPMIATIIFYVWLFMNYRSFGVGPKIYEPIMLGSLIALALAFLINNFSKISLHTVGMGGLVGAIVVCRLALPKYAYHLKVGEGFLSISPNVLLGAVVLIAGLVGSSRLLLSAHRSEDVYGGYVVGFISQVIAYRILF